MAFVHLCHFLVLWLFDRDSMLRDHRIFEEQLSDLYSNTSKSNSGNNKNA
jgi:hypothetical protein